MQNRYSCTMTKYCLQTPDMFSMTHEDCKASPLWCPSQTKLVLFYLASSTPPHPSTMASLWPATFNFILVVSKHFITLIILQFPAAMANASVLSFNDIQARPCQVEVEDKSILVFPSPDKDPDNKLNEGLTIKSISPRVYVGCSDRLGGTWAECYFFFPLSLSLLLGLAACV